LGRRGDGLWAVPALRRRARTDARVTADTLDAVEAGDDQALGCRDEAEDAEHRRTAVVDLHVAPALLLRLRLLGKEAEWV